MAFCVFECVFIHACDSTVCLFVERNSCVCERKSGESLPEARTDLPGMALLTVHLFMKECMNASLLPLTYFTYLFRLALSFCPSPFLSLLACFLFSCSCPCSECLFQCQRCSSPSFDFLKRQITKTIHRVQMQQTEATESSSRQVRDQKRKREGELWGGRTCCLKHEKKATDVCIYLSDSEREEQD